MSFMAQHILFLKNSTLLLPPASDSSVHAALENLSDLIEFPDSTSALLKCVKVGSFHIFFAGHMRRPLRPGLRFLAVRVPGQRGVGGQAKRVVGGSWPTTSENRQKHPLEARRGAQLLLGCGRQVKPTPFDPL